MESGEKPDLGNTHGGRKVCREELERMHMGGGCENEWALCRLKEG